MKQLFTFSIMLVLGILSVSEAQIFVPADFETIQEAVDAAAGGDTVIVADGIYRGAGNRNIDFRGKSITVRSERGPEACVIDCEGSENVKRRGFYLHGGETHDSVIDGFTIINGSGRDLEYPGGSGPGGGAIACVNSAATIRNCAFKGNFAWHGGGIFTYRANVIIEGCDFYENLCKIDGAAICCWESVALITDCRVENNTARHGGAIYAWGAGAVTTIERCDVIGNVGEMWAGGIGLWGDSTITDCVIQSNHGALAGGIYAKANCTIRSCLITDNTSTGASGGIGCEPEISYPIESFAVIENCTIAYNINDGGKSGGIDFNFGLESALVRNCIVWGNSARWSDQIDAGSMGDDLVVSFCDVQDGWEGEGNIDADPLFADAEEGDYHLTRSSHCVNGGDPDYAGPLTTDFDGEERVMNDRIDIGVDELFFVNNAPVAAAGEDITANATIEGVATVVLDGSGSTDVDGDELTYRWFRDGAEIGTGVNPTIELAAGEHVIELVAADRFEESEPDTVVVTVVGAIEADMYVVPGVLNYGSRGRKIMAVVTLPDGLDASQIDPDESFVLLPGNAKDLFFRSTGGKGNQRIYILFDVTRLMDSIGNIDNVEVRVVGTLESGKYFFGADTLRINRKKSRDRITVRNRPLRSTRNRR